MVKILSSFFIWGWFWYYLFSFFLFLGTIIDVKEVLYEISSLFSMCLLWIKMLLSKITVNKGLLLLCGLLFSSAMPLLMMLFLPPYSLSWMRWHSRIHLVWLLRISNSRGVFTVKYYHLNLLAYSSVSTKSGSFGQFPGKIIWKTLAPSKVSVFVWEASHGSIFDMW